MNYIALYRKWRPLTFEDVVEQQSVVTILKNAVISRRIAHAYLFCGTRGTGKTSIAKIFSRAINCKNPVDGSPCNQCEICRGILNESLLDVSEIDAASNNGVDQIRKIIDESNYQASAAEYKVFIIDEVHMLSTAAFNALLKTLEEPPEKVVFILATTEPHKLPVTVLSRCQRYDFKRISQDGIVSRLEQICQSLDCDYELQALKYIAGKSEGAMRDAISLLDQTVSTMPGKLTLDLARRSTGSLDRGTMEDFATALIGRDGFGILTLVDRVFAEGADPSNFICELIDLLRELMIILATRNPQEFLYETNEDIERLRVLANNSNTKELSMIIRELSALENTLKWSVQRKIIFEAGMLSLCDRSWGKDAEVSDRLLALERSVADLANEGLKVQYRGGSFNIPVAQTVDNAITPAAEDETAPKTTVADITKDVLKELSPCPEVDWNDYMLAVEEKNPGLSSMLEAVESKGYIVGNTLFITIRDESFVGVVNSGKNEELLKGAMAGIFGNTENVTVLPEERFFEQAPERIRRSKNRSAEEEAFEKAKKQLEKISKKDGFATVIEEQDSGESAPFSDESDYNEEDTQSGTGDGAENDGPYFPEQGADFENNEFEPQAPSEEDAPPEDTDEDYYDDNNGSPFSFAPEED